MTEQENPCLLTDEEIKNKLAEIEPDGFDWTDITDTEMIKLKAISQAQHDKMVKMGWRPPMVYNAKFEADMRRIYKE